MAPVNEFRCTWSNTETKILINLVKELNLANDLCLKHHNADIFQRLSFEFQSRHNIIRRQDQIRLRWKLLKQEYMRAKKSNCVDGMSKSTQSLYEDLDLLLGRYVSVSKHRVTAEPHHSHEHFDT